MSVRPQHARVDLPGLGCIPALVEIDGAHATAVLLARPIRPLTGMLGEEVTIHLTTARGLLRFDARIVSAPGSERLELDVHTRCDLVQRRTFARINAFLEAVAVVPGGARTMHAAIVNISAAGAVIARLDGLSPGDAVDLSVTLVPHEPPVEIGGRVVREFEGVLRAVDFERIYEVDRERIVRFVIARQRLEIKRAGLA
jgi:c-di-GMP-binding flagellar brake protein YcgR